MGKEKITYILGAGASIGAFPLVKPANNRGGLAHELNKKSIDLELIANQNKKALSDEALQFFAEMKTVLKETSVGAIEFGNVDTYAKYLYHTKRTDDLKKLKLALSYFFIEPLMVKNGWADNEKRYLNFVTSIIDDSHLFPENVKVLSWNYDYLLESATKRYISEGKSRKDDSTFVNSYPNNTIRQTSENPKFSIVHLNGIAGFYQFESDKRFRDVYRDFNFHPSNKKFEVHDFLYMFYGRNAESQPLITFAWEKDSETKKSLINSYEIAKEIIKDTTILVVIGYSFPFYNREIDNMIFNQIEPSLKKIYYQDPYIDGEFLRSRYNLPPQKAKYEDYSALQLMELDKFTREKGTKSLKIEHVTNTDQFYIPVEL